MSDPASKYADRVSPEHRLAMQSITMAAAMIDAHEEHLTEVLECESRMHSIGHILDPTLYRDMINSKSFETQLKIIRAALAFSKEVKAMVEG